MSTNSLEPWGYFYLLVQRFPGTFLETNRLEQELSMMLLHLYTVGSWCHPGINNLTTSDIRLILDQM
jgi:hypothetical protein